MSTRVLIRGYARHRGVDEKAVRKAIAAGRITKGAEERSTEIWYNSCCLTTCYVNNNTRCESALII